MNQSAEVYFVISIVFVLISVVFVLFIIFHNKKMMEHAVKITEMEIAKSKQDLKDSIEIQENERARIGADLHDELGPTLSAVKLKINSISGGRAMKEEEWSHLKEMIDQTITNVRSLSHELYPNTLKEFGLPDAIRELIQRISSLTTVQFKTDIDPGIKSLDFKDQLSLYRIIQEFFNNSLKHSQCSEIHFSLKYPNQELQLELHDNGKGYSSDQDVQDGLGLKNMRMRAESINADFQITSSPGKGTTLFIYRKS